MTRLFEILRTISTLLFLASCGSPYKQLAKIEHKHPLQFTEYCSKRFEPIVKVIDSIVYIKGKDSVRIDTLAFNVDSLVNSLKSGKNTIVRIPCPPCVIPNDTVMKFRTIENVNKALIETLELREKGYIQDLAKKDAIIEQKTKSNKDKTLGIAVCVGLLSLMVLLNIKLRY